MKRVYIAGPYSSDNVLGVLENIRRGMRMATTLLRKGVSVFCPWTDHQLFLQLREGEAVSVEQIQAHSIEWLKVSDAVLVLKGYEASKGTLAEMKVALERNIPVFFSYLDLMAWVEKEEAPEDKFLVRREA